MIYATRTQQVQAVRWTGSEIDNGVEPIPRWCEELMHDGCIEKASGARMRIWTSEGDEYAEAGDYIVFCDDGEVRPVKKSDFETGYELIGR